MISSQHGYEIRPRKDKRGVNLISDTLPFGRLWYAEPNTVSNAIGYAKFFSRSHDAVIRVYDVDSNVIESSLEERANTQKKPGSAGIFVHSRKSIDNAVQKCAGALQGMTT